MKNEAFISSYLVLAASDRFCCCEQVGSCCIATFSLGAEIVGLSGGVVGGDFIWNVKNGIGWEGMWWGQDTIAQSKGIQDALRAKVRGRTIIEMLMIFPYCFPWRCFSHIKVDIYQATLFFWEWGKTYIFVWCQVKFTGTYMIFIVPSRDVS